MENDDVDFALERRQLILDRDWIVEFSSIAEVEKEELAPVVSTYADESENVH